MMPIARALSGPNTVKRFASRIPLKPARRFEGQRSPRDAVAILAEVDRHRTLPELVPERYARMSVDPVCVPARRRRRDGGAPCGSTDRWRSGAGRRRQPFDEFWGFRYA